MSDDRVGRAYRELVGDLPAGFGLGAIDLRPQRTADGHRSEPEPQALILSGTDDLAELRTVVERVTGPGTWPFRDEVGAAWAQTDRYTVQVQIERPAQLMGLIVALDDRLPDNSAAWRTRKTLREALGVSLDGLTSVSAVACRFERV